LFAPGHAGDDNPYNGAGPNEARCEIVVDPGTRTQSGHKMTDTGPAPAVVYRTFSTVPTSLSVTMRTAMYEDPGQPGPASCL
jgi:hypothetical protein